MAIMDCSTSGAGVTPASRPRRELLLLFVMVVVVCAALAWTLDQRIGQLAQERATALTPEVLHLLRWELLCAMVGIAVLVLAGAHRLLRRSEASLRPLISERERDRLVLAEQNARLNTVFDLSPDGFVVFDQDLRLVFVNQAFLAMTGWEDKAALRHETLASFNQRMCDLHDPAYALPPLSMQRGDETPFDTMDLLHLRLPRPRVLTRLVRHNAGGRGESILYFRDVTHETEVDRMKSEFLTTAAHELRTPMVSVFGFTELLLTRPVPEQQRRDMLQTIHRQASLLINLVNELLDLARIEARQDQALNRRPCAVRELLTSAVSAMAGGASKRHEMVIEEPLHDGQVMGDPDKLLRALNNVLSNAQKYSPAGGVIRLGTQQDSPGQRMAIWVQDEGIGMTPEQTARIFERFYRADPSGNIPGTGLGMSLVKEIVDLHQGDIEVQSTPLRGTRVTLYLPLAARLKTSQKDLSCTV
jgi:signal transduction histidine kinase